ncbi:restriction endonuclease subunit S [Franconibacter daqui]|uniref:restriction endonuclease subunit S n=1 Tax=Franconibacter daqui TaxID=2047724 RepID=UPI0030CA6207
MSREKLPEGWGETEVGDIADVISGGTPKSGITENFAPSGEGIAWLTPADLSGYKNKFISHGARDLSTLGYSSCSAKLMPAGAILFSSRAPIGYVAVASNEISTNQGFKSFVFTNDIYPDYAYYYLRNIRHLAEEMGTGTTFKEISGSATKTLPFVIAPLAEQKIIAEKLDTLLAQVDSTKARLEQIPQILKRFRQAVLASVVCGKLSKNTGQWKTYLLKNICISISDGDHQAPPKSETGIPFLVISDVNKGQIDFENVSRWVPESYYESLKEIRKPFQNDILYTVTGSYGIPVIVNTTKPFCFQRHIAIIKPNSTFIDYKFLAFYLESPQIFKHASDVATGTAQKTVSLSSLRNFELSVPSLEEQHEIVRRVEQLFAYADTIEKQVNNALARVNSLTQSILAKAFRGELTAQWRAENPDLISGENSAAALLEKIKAERAASGGKKAARKKA